MSPLVTQTADWLAALGLTTAIDDHLLTHVVESVTATVLAETNRPDIPDGLLEQAAQVAAGKYLLLKKGMGLLDGFDIGTAVKQIQEGDTNTVFAFGDGSFTPEQRLDTAIAQLCAACDGQYGAYRRLVW